MDRMRESMFSILGNLEGLSFLDVFSGSGAIGIEAASRGADPVELVEKDKIKKNTILENISWVESTINLHLMPGEIYIKNCGREFDIVHFDPPFPMKGKEKFLQLADQYGIVKKGGTLMMHYPDEENFDEQIGSLRQYDQRKYGRSMLIFYTRD